MNGLVGSSAIGVAGMAFSSERLKPLSPTTLVMAGLVPAIHVLGLDTKTWMPGTSPGMTNDLRGGESLAARRHPGRGVLQDLGQGLVQGRDAGGRRVACRGNAGAEALRGDHLGRVVVDQLGEDVDVGGGLPLALSIWNALISMESM